MVTLDKAAVRLDKSAVKRLWKALDKAVAHNNSRRKMQRQCFWDAIPPLDREGLFRKVSCQDL